MILAEVSERFNLNPKFQRWQNTATWTYNQLLCHAARSVCSIHRLTVSDVDPSSTLDMAPFDFGIAKAWASREGSIHRAMAAHCMKLFQNNRAARPNLVHCMNCAARLRVVLLFNVVSG